MNKPIAVIGTFIKDFQTALNLAEKKGADYGVIKADTGYLVVKESYLARAVASPESLGRV